MPKILSAVASGIAIVSDDWAKQCVDKKKLVDHEPFLVRDEERERDWNVPENWSTGEVSRQNLMKGYTLYITPSLKKDYDDFKAIDDLARLVGVKKVVSKPSRAAPPNEDNTILLGLAQGDIDAVALYEAGRKVYEKDFLPMSILRGEICLDDYDIEPALALPSVKKGAKKSGKM